MISLHPLHHTKPCDLMKSPIEYKRSVESVLADSLEVNCSCSNVYALRPYVIVTWKERLVSLQSRRQRVDVLCRTLLLMGSCNGYQVRTFVSLVKSSIEYKRSVESVLADSLEVNCSCSNVYALRPYVIVTWKERLVSLQSRRQRVDVLCRTFLPLPNPKRSIKNKIQAVSQKRSDWYLSDADNRQDALIYPLTQARNLEIGNVLCGTSLEGEAVSKATVP
jgi:hypothetical protein